MNKYCSPKSKNNTVTCFSKDSLLKIAKELNKIHNTKIYTNNIESEHDLHKLWKNILDVINKKYENKCKQEHCWLNLNFSKKIIDDIENDFRPPKPIEWYNNNNTWLSTSDINSAVKPYEDKHLDYLFIGAVPIDFDFEIIPGMCVSDELCKIDLENLYIYKGIRKIGVIFNLDNHNQSGSHWVSLYIDLNNGGIYYFDSYGTTPKQEVQKLMEKIRIKGNKLINDNIINYHNINDQHMIKTSFDHITETEIKIPIDVKIQKEIPIFFSDNKDNLFNIVNISKNNNEKIIHLNKKIEKKDKSIYLCQKGFRKFYNNIQFQYKGSECGVYSMFFQTELLSGKKFVDILKNIIDDDTINTLRDNLYYRPDKE